MLIRPAPQGSHFVATLGYMAKRRWRFERQKELNDKRITKWGQFDEHRLVVPLSPPSQRGFEMFP